MPSLRYSTLAYFWAARHTVAAYQIDLQSAQASAKVGWTSVNTKTTPTTATMLSRLTQQRAGPQAALLRRRIASTMPRTPSSPATRHQQKRTLVAAPKRGDGPLMERRADRELPGTFPPFPPVPQKTITTNNEYPLPQTPAKASAGRAPSPSSPPPSPSHPLPSSTTRNHPAPSSAPRSTRCARRTARAPTSATRSTLRSRSRGSRAR